MADRDWDLARENAELEQVFQRAPIGLCVLDRKFRYVRVNERLAEMNGRPIAEHLGRPLDEIVPVLAGRAKADLQLVLERGEPVLDRRISRPLPGQPTVRGDWLVSYYPLHVQDGSVQGFIIAVAEEALQESEQRYRALVEMSPDAAVVHADQRFQDANPAARRLYGAVGVDITDRKEAEETLRRAELRHRRFLDAVPVGVVYWKGNRIITDANDDFLVMLGLTREDIRAGRVSLADLTPEEFRRESDEALAELSTQGVVGPFEKAYRRKDGSVVPVLVSSVLQTDAGEPTVTSFVLDLNEQKRTERALRESEERLRFHIENTTLAVIEWDARFVVTRWSGQAERMFGWTAAETVGKHVSDLHIIYVGDVSIVDGVLRQLTDGATRQFASMNRNYTKDGRVLHCRW